jgi:hypothetical protein
MALFADNFNTIPPRAAGGQVLADNFNVAVPIVTPTAPSAPTGFTASARTGGASLSWTQPAGGTPTDYRLTATAGSVVRVFSFTNSSPVAITGLIDGTAYTLSLTARNTVGASSAATTTVTPDSTAAAPGSSGNPVISPSPILSAAPTLNSVTAYDTGALALWTAPTDNGGSTVSSYVVYAALASDGSPAFQQTVPATQTQVGLQPLSNGVSYVVTVTALNAVGESKASNAITVTPTAGLAVLDPPSDVPAPVEVIPPPMMEAFPAERPFVPSNWLLTPEEADANV